MTNPRPGVPSRPNSRVTRRDRRGRGPRTPLLPADLPASRSRAEQFDQVVLEAVTVLQARFAAELATVEFAVDDVPPIPLGGLTSDRDVITDGGVPLARYLPAGIDQRGKQTKARVVVYRRPIEMRAGEMGDIGDLVEDILTEQVAAILGDAAPEQEE